MATPRRPPRIILFSDGKETSPSNPDNPRGAFTAARAAHDQGIPISTISFGTPDGTVTVDGSQVPVPVDDTTMKKVAQLSGGTAYSASDLKHLEQVYKSLQDQIGYETIRGEASGGWLRLGAACPRHRRHRCAGDQSAHAGLSHGRFGGPADGY